MIVSPSLLGADSSRYGEEIRLVTEAGAQFLHIDVMDGHFVPNLSFGPTLIAKLRKATDLIFDVHLMIEDPMQYAKRFIDAGANYLTIHLETAPDPVEIKNLCDQHNVKFGIALKPKTDLETIIEHIDLIDLLLIMGIEPGGEGKRMIPETVERIAQVRSIRKEKNANFLISVDGGINNITGKLCSDAGADILVAGGYIFNSQDKKDAVTTLLNV